MPGALVDEWRAEAWWADTAALAHTLAYDSATVGDLSGGTVPLEGR